MEACPDVKVLISCYAIFALILCNREAAAYSRAVAVVMHLLHQLAAPVNNLHQPQQVTTTHHSNENTV
jgi:hypothetical protein